jgi:hypothetical protein
MGASLIQPAAHGREHGSVPMRRGKGATRSTRKSALVGCLLAAALAGCNGDSGLGAEPLVTPSDFPTTGTATASSAATPPPVDEQSAILSQYRLFWKSLTPVAKLPASLRRAALARYTVDPELKSLLAGMAMVEARQRRFYGADLPRAATASISPDSLRSVVDDCQDSSHAGLSDGATGRRLTYGSARNHVVVTMNKASGIWKVYFVSYVKTPC